MIKILLTEVGELSLKLGVLYFALILHKNMHIALCTAITNVLIILMQEEAKNLKLKLIRRCKVKT